VIIPCLSRIAVENSGFFVTDWAIKEVAADDLGEVAYNRDARESPFYQPQWRMSIMYSDDRPCCSLGRWGMMVFGILVPAIGLGLLFSSGLGVIDFWASK